MLHMNKQANDSCCENYKLNFQATANTKALLCYLASNEAGDGCCHSDEEWRCSKEARCT